MKEVDIHNGEEATVAAVKLLKDKHLVGMLVKCTELSSASHGQAKI